MNRRAFLSAVAASSLVHASAQAQAPPPAPLTRFGAAAQYSAQHGGVSFVLVRNGIVLAEDYPHSGNVNARWPIGAGARGFVSLLAASLVKDDLLSLDELVSMTFGDWALHPIKSAISVRALLNGTSGIAFNGAAGDTNAAIALEPVASLGQRFIADPAPYMIMVELAHRKLALAGASADPARYLTDRTLGPIGCAPVGFTRDPTGAPLLYDGMAVSARGWADAGELIRREGVWRADQLVDANAAREALRGTFAEARAGMGFWLASPGRDRSDPPGADSDLWRGSSPAPLDLAMAAGEGGQRLFISQSERLVIVRQAQGASAGWSDADFLSLTLRDLERRA